MIVCCVLIMGVSFGIGIVVVFEFVCEGVVFWIIYVGCEVEVYCVVEDCCVVGVFEVWVFCFDL